MQDIKTDGEVDPNKVTAKAIAPEYTQRAWKFTKWCEYFFDKNNKETYGNATQSVLRVYDTKDYYTAGAIGYQNYKKLQNKIPNIGAAIADKEGFDFAEMMKIGMAKMLKGNFDDWERMMIRLGHFEEKPKALVQQNNFSITNIQDAIKASREQRGIVVEDGATY